MPTVFVKKKTSVEKGAWALPFVSSFHSSEGHGHQHHTPDFFSNATYLLSTSRGGSGLGEESEAGKTHWSVSEMGLKFVAGRL